MTPPLSSFAIVGSGAIGTYYGARLARSGREVRFLARSEAELLRTQGIRIVEKAGAWTVPPDRFRVSTSPADLGPVDVVLVTLKTTANAELVRLLPPLVGPQTLVVTLQNGLGNEDLLASLVGPERVLGGLCFIASTRTAPGEVTCYHPGSITLGEFGRPPSDRTHALAGVFSEAGVRMVVVESLEEARWRKLIWNVPFNGLTIAAGGVPTDRICASPELLAEVWALMREVQTAAARLGHTIPDDFLQKQVDVTPPMGPYKPSSLVDFLAHRPVEIEPIWGEPLRRAGAAGVPTPRLALLYALLRTLAEGKA
jgi:2-dehydropantoate 2-reductase